MNRTKRQLIENISMEKKAKESRSKLSFDKKVTTITYIEHLSNELFYEIFEYLDGCDIFNGFSNLNIRFQNLLNHISLRLKMSIQFKSISQFQDNYLQFILSNRHRIVSLRLLDLDYINSFLQLCNFNSSFSRLESLVFVDIKSDEFISLIPNLTQLPRLSSLTIYLRNDCQISNDFYHLIFCLPCLKYSKISSNASSYHIPSSSFIDKRISKIEYLIIDHPCGLNQLIAILSCTPELRYLTCKGMIVIDDKIKSQNLPILSDLTHLFFYQCQLRFDDLEMFIEKISSQLRVLYINTSSDDSYLDADRWKKLISEYLPFLRTFNFEYIDFIPTRYDVLINKFTSPFWIDRRWILELKIDIYQESTTKIIYSIHSQKKKWFILYQPGENNTYCHRSDDMNLVQRNDIHGEQENTNPSIPFSEGTEFIVQGHGLITCLHIGYFYPFSIDVLVELIGLLPNLDSLMISYVSLHQIRNLSEKQLNDVCLASNNNRIIRVRIGGVTNLEQIHTLINLCPKIQHIEIGHTDDIDRKLLIRSIMMKNIDKIPYLCSMYLLMPDIDEKLLKTFQKSIDLDKLLDEYKISCMSNGIYLKWDRHRLIALKRLSYMQLRNQKH